MKKIFALLFCMFSLSISIQAEMTDSIGGHPIPIIDTGETDPIIGDVPHAPMVPPLVILDNHTLCFYAEAEKQVSVYPVDYDDETEPLYSVSVPEYNYSTALPSWLSGTYVIEIVLDGHTFVGEIKL